MKPLTIAGLLVALIPAQASANVVSTFTAIQQGNGVVDLQLVLNIIGQTPVSPLYGCSPCYMDPGFFNGGSVTIADGQGNSAIFTPYNTGVSFTPPTFPPDVFDFITTYQHGDYTATFDGTIDVIGAICCFGGEAPGMTGHAGVNISGNADVQSTPIPGTITLFGAALTFLAGWRRVVRWRQLRRDRRVLVALAAR